MAQVNPYDNSRNKTEQVEEMFDSIAPAYDFMNRAMSFGLHVKWRDKALDAVLKNIPADADCRVLDVATGTGDVAFDLHRRLPNAEITGVDLSEGMLALAREKLAKMHDAEKNEAGKSCTEKSGAEKSAEGKSDEEKISFCKGDSMALDLPDNSFDLVTVAYGVRNFENIVKGLSELKRVLRPGGRLCVIELSEPVSPLVRFAYRVYSRTLIPFVGRCVSGDSRAYSYLPESIAAAPQRDAMADAMRRAGFGKCQWKSLTFGVVTYYIAE